MTPKPRVLGQSRTAFCGVSGTQVVATTVCSFRKDIHRVKSGFAFKSLYWAAPKTPHKWDSWSVTHNGRSGNICSPHFCVTFCASEPRAVFHRLFGRFWRVETRVFSLRKKGQWSLGAAHGIMTFLPGTRCLSTRNTWSGRSSGGPTSGQARGA